MVFYEHQVFVVVVHVNSTPLSTVGMSDDQ